MADTKKTTKPSEKRVDKRNEADVKGLFAMYGDFGKGNKPKGTTKKK